MDHVATNSPSAVANLEADTRYFVQNQGNDPVKISFGATAPTDDTAPGRVLVSLEGDFFKLSTGDAMHVWTLEPGIATVVNVSEAVLP